MSEQKTTNQAQSIGALIVIIFAVLAIVAALVIGGVKLFGADAPQDSDENPSASGGIIDPDDRDFKTVAWPSDARPLSQYPILGGTLVIPTAENEYTPADSSMQNIISKYEGQTQFMLTTTEMKIDKEANEALLAMTAALNSACSFSETLQVHSVYSTVADVDYRSGLTVRFRLNRSGVTDYLTNATGDNPVTWLEQNAWKYGFILRYPEGSTIEGKENGVQDVYRYVGIPHAYYITHELAVESDDAFGMDENIGTLDDYVKALKNATVKNPLACNIVGLEKGNGFYSMYYVPAAEVDSAEIREDSQVYSVSADGTGYFVTTYITSEATAKPIELVGNTYQYASATLEWLSADLKAEAEKAGNTDTKLLANYSGENITTLKITFEKDKIKTEYTVGGVAKSGSIGYTKVGNVITPEENSLFKTATVTADAIVLEGEALKDACKVIIVMNKQ